MALEVGTLIYNRYRIEEILAQGGMGAIYRAVDESLGVTVAVKENLIASDESTRQFHREATILAGLRHSNLPRVTDHFVIVGKGQYLVMDFIEGEDLKQWITKKGKLSEEEAILIIIAVCDALNYLHSLNPPIVHRDIKPGNIKISPNGQPFLVDFGLAKVAIKGEHTSLGAQALTPGYAPPEQYGKGTDTRSDIYSLAATLYCALTGSVPEDALGRAVGSAELTPINQLNPQVTQRLENVVYKAMAVVPSERYQTIGEFKQALLNANTAAYQKTTQMGGDIRIDPFIRSTSSAETWKGKIPDEYRQPVTGSTPSSPFLSRSAPVQSRPITAPPPTETQKKGSTGIILAVVGIILIVVIGMAVIGGVLYFSGGLDSILGINAVSTNTVSVKAEIATATESMEMPTSTEGVMIPSDTPVPTFTQSPTETFTPAVTPNGGGFGEIAFVSDRTGIPQIWMMGPDGSNQRQFTDIASGACQPDWSPDGNRLVFVSPCRKRQESYEGSGLFLINSDGSGMIPLPTSPGGDFDPAWSSEGMMIAFTSLRKGIPHIYIFNLNDNTPKEVTESVSARDRRPAWSPDGKYLAFETTRPGQSQVWYRPIDDSDKPREFSVYANGVGGRPAWSSDGSTIYYSQGDALPWLASKSFENKGSPEVKVSDLRPIWDVDVSPDGFWLVFESIKDVNNIDIFIMTSNGGGLLRLTDDKGTDFNPTWRPRQ